MTRAGRSDQLPWTSASGGSWQWSA